MAALSAYELTRLETIRTNNEFLLKLGILDDAKAMRPKPKAPPKPKVKVEPPSGPARHSKRLDGMPAEETELEEDEEPNNDAPQKVARDHFRCWWTSTEENREGVMRPRLTSLQLRALETPLSAEDRESLEIDGDKWVTDMLQFSRAYGGKFPVPFCVPSRENFKKVLDTVSVLASGEGVRCNYRSGAFDAGRHYTPRDDLDEALGRALKWLPKAKDKSNGWTFSHPFEKMKQYQRALFWRHLFPFVWPDAEVPDRAQEVAMAKSEACAGDEAMATVWMRMAGLADGETDDEEDEHRVCEFVAKRKKRA